MNRRLILTIALMLLVSLGIVTAYLLISAGNPTNPIQPNAVTVTPIPSYQCESWCGQCGIGYVACGAYCPAADECETCKEGDCRIDSTKGGERNYTALPGNNIAGHTQPGSATVTIGISGTTSVGELAELANTANGIGVFNDVEGDLISPTNLGLIGESCSRSSDCGAIGTTNLECLSCGGVGVCGDPDGTNEQGQNWACIQPGSEPKANDECDGAGLFSVKCTTEGRGEVCLSTGWSAEMPTAACGTVTEDQQGFLGCSGPDNCHSCYQVIREGESVVECYTQPALCGAKDVCLAKSTDDVPTVDSPDTSAGTTCTSLQLNGGNAEIAAGQQAQYIATFTGIDPDLYPNIRLLVSSNQTTSGAVGNDVDNVDSQLVSPASTTTEGNITRYIFTWQANSDLAVGSYGVSVLLDGTNSGRITADQCNQTLNVSENLAPAPLITIVKESSYTCTDTSAVITYTIDINNTGDEAGNITSLVDTLPNTINGISQVSNINPVATVNQSRLSWNQSQEIGAGQTRTYTYDVTLMESQLDTASSGLTNSATVTYSTGDSSGNVAIFDLTTYVNCLPDTALWDDPTSILFFGLVLVLIGLVINRSGLILNWATDTDLYRDNDASTDWMEKLFGRTQQRFETTVVDQAEFKRKRQKIVAKRKR